MFENTTDIEDIATLGIEPLKHIVELIERYSGEEKTVIALSVAAESMLDEICKCIYRLIEEDATEPTDTAKQSAEATE